MNPLSKLFSKTPSTMDIRLQLKQVERDQWKKLRELDAMEQQKKAKVEEAVAAKKAGRQELVQDIFREMRQAEIDYAYINSDLRRLSLSKTALMAFLRKLEMLEKDKDRKSLQSLMRRYNNSSMQKTIDQAEVDDDTFGNMLQEILGETEVAVAQEKEQEDAGFAEFDRAIEEMASAGASDGREQPTPEATHTVKSKLSSSHAIAPRYEREDVENKIKETKQQIREMERQIAEKREKLAKLRERAKQLKSRAELVRMYTGEDKTAEEQALDLERRADEAEREAEETERGLEIDNNNLQNYETQLASLENQLGQFA
jgi:archaellum component FlaC